MQAKTLFTAIFVLGLIFIGAGDSFLPQPLSNLSRNTRTNFNRILVGLIPNPQIEKPSQQREEQMREFEHEAGGNSK